MHMLITTSHALSLPPTHAPARTALQCQWLCKQSNESESKPGHWKMTVAPVPTKPSEPKQWMIAILGSARLGSVYGEFKLIDCLATNGFSCDVYLAEHTVSGVRRALKMYRQCWEGPFVRPRW